MIHGWFKQSSKLYLSFIFILPNVVCLDKYKADVQSIVKEQTNLNLDFDNIKLSTTPLLSAGVIIDNISIKLPDNTVLFSADNIKTRISLPSLTLLTVKLSCLEINKPTINLEIAQDGTEYKIVKLVEDILNEQKSKNFGVKKEVKQGFQFNPEWIRIKVPNAKLNEYKVLITDLKTNHHLDIHGEKLTAGYFNGKIYNVVCFSSFCFD